MVGLTLENLKVYEIEISLACLAKELKTRNSIKYPMKVRHLGCSDSREFVNRL